nr:hypothetical protein [Candidatus Freyarchaeota archaeon]
MDSESLYFESLLTETAAYYERIDLMPAYNAYLSWWNGSLMAGLGATPLDKTEAGDNSYKRKGCRAWAEMFLGLIDDSQKWLKGLLLTLYVGDWRASCNCSKVYRLSLQSEFCLEELNAFSSITCDLISTWRC